MPDSYGKRQRREVKAKKQVARDERREARKERRAARAAGDLPPGSPIEASEPDDDGWRPAEPAT